MCHTAEAVFSGMLGRMSDALPGPDADAQTPGDASPRVEPTPKPTFVRAATGPNATYPPPDRWDDWVEYDSRSWPKRVEKRYMLVPTLCFNCEAACGLLAYVDKETLEIRKFEGNPVHPGSRGRN